jgi:hypothetical protein
MRAKQLIDRRREAAADRLSGPRKALAIGITAVKGIYRTGRGVGRWSERRAHLTTKPPSAVAAGGAFAAGIALGAVGAYLFDPADGKRRRHVGRDRLASLARRGAREATNGHGGSAEELNDQTLASNVESVERDENLRTVSPTTR